MEIIVAGNLPVRPGTIRVMAQFYPTSPEPDALVVLGPTASGKTALGVQLARALGGEILSADSRQVYRGLNVGTGKDLAEYAAGGAPVPYHLIDIADPAEEYNVFAFQRDCYTAIDEVGSRGALPVIAGGTGLYLEAVLSGYAMVEAPENPELRAELGRLSDSALAARLAALCPALHNTTDTSDRERMIRAIEIAEYAADHAPPERPPLNALVLGIRWPREELRERIRARLKQRLGEGLIEEVQGLIASGLPAGRLLQLGLEYRFVAQFLAGEIKNRNDLFQKLAAAIIQFAKRQETWFRRMERNGCAIQWIDRADPEAAMRVAEAAFPSRRAP